MKFSYLLRYLVTFLAGLISGVFLLVKGVNLLDRSDFGDQRDSVSLNTEYFRHELVEICSVLEKEGCSCQPFVRTELSCDSTLNLAVAKKYRELRDSN